MAEYWAMAVYDLRLTSEQFYRLTPRGFHLLAKRYAANRRHTELLHAQTVWAVITFSLAPPKKPVTFEQFMPSEWRVRAPEPTRRRTNNQIAEDCRVLFKSLAAASRR